MLENISRVIKESKSFFLTTHLNPDGDAIGSILAFDSLLRKTGMDGTSYMVDPIPDNFKFLNNSDIVVHSLENLNRKKYDLAIVLDSTDWERVGGRPNGVVEFGKVINIDHHISNSNFGDINLVDPDASAVGEIIYDLICKLDVQLTLNIARCLYTAIMTDTGNFTYSNTNARAFEVSEKLVSRGVVPDTIAEEVNESYSVSRLNLLKMALDTLEFSDDRKIGAMTISQKMFKKTDTSPYIIEGFIDYPRYVSGVKVAILFRELPEGGYKVSFRSRGSLNVSDVAGIFGGGGHVNASGCSIPGSLAEVKRKVFKIVKKALTKGGGQ